MFGVADLEDSFDADDSDRGEPDGALMIDLDHVRTLSGDDVEHSRERTRTIGHQHFEDNVAAVADQNLFDNACEHVSIDISTAKHRTDAFFRTYLDLSGHDRRDAGRTGTFMLPNKRLFAAAD